MRKFGIGVGILTSGPSGSTHGAGPSGHTTFPQTASALISMDVDDIPSATERGVTPLEGIMDGVSPDRDKEETAADEKPLTDGEAS